MKRAALFVLALISTTTAHAQSFFMESEPNNSISQAQFLNTPEGKLVVFGNRTVDNRSADWYRIWGSQKSLFNILVSTPGGSMRLNDPIVGLFDSQGQEIAFSDDLQGPYGLDAGIFNYRIINSGYYYIAVSGHADREFRGGGGDGRDNIWTYNLAVGRTSVPEPSEWAVIGMGISGVVGLMLRARQKSEIS